MEIEEVTSKIQLQKERQNTAKTNFVKISTTQMITTYIYYLDIFV